MAPSFNLNAHFKRDFCFFFCLKWLIAFIRLWASLQDEIRSNVLLTYTLLSLTKPLTLTKIPTWVMLLLLPSNDWNSNYPYTPHSGPHSSHWIIQSIEFAPKQDRNALTLLSHRDDRVSNNLAFGMWQKWDTIEHWTTYTHA